MKYPNVAIEESLAGSLTKREELSRASWEAYREGDTETAVIKLQEWLLSDRVFRNIHDGTLGYDKRDEFEDHVTDFIVDAIPGQELEGKLRKRVFETFDPSRSTSFANFAINRFRFFCLNFHKKKGRDAESDLRTSEPQDNGMKEYDVRFFERLAGELLTEEESRAVQLRKEQTEDHVISEASRKVMLSGLSGKKNRKVLLAVLQHKTISEMAHDWKEPTSKVKRQIKDVLESVKRIRAGKKTISTQILERKEELDSMKFQGVRAKIVRLLLEGMDPQDIGQAMGREGNYISTVLGAVLEKMNRKKKKIE